MLANPLAFLLTLSGYRSPSLRLELPSGAIENLTQIQFMKVTTYAGDLHFPRRIAFDDGLFQVHWLHKTSRWRLFFRFLEVSLLRRWDRGSDGLAITPELRIRSVVPVPVELDGEIEWATEIDIRCHQKKLRVMT